MQSRRFVNLIEWLIRFLASLIFTTEASAVLQNLCIDASPQMDARSGGSGRSGRKRKLLTFSEVTDAFVEARVRSEREAWVLAKSRKIAGDDALFNTLGPPTCVPSLVAKVRRAWSCEDMETGTLHTKPDYKLCMFIRLGSVDAALVQWVQKLWRTHALILCGEGGLGKTELACTLAHAVAKSDSFHFVNKVDRIRDVFFSPGEALVVDEACFATRDIDDAKALIDIVKSRDVSCRNKDGRIPKHTPRIFSTNWTWEQFWPREAFSVAHMGAIKRRVVWIDVKLDLRRPKAGTTSSVDSSEDPFGHGTDIS